MNRFRVSLRIFGTDTLEEVEPIRAALAAYNIRVLQRGTRLTARRVQPVDIVLLELARWEQSPNISDEPHWLAIATLLEELVPKLAFVDRSRAHIDLYISAFRETDQGGLDLPPALLSALAALHAALAVSIPVSFDDEQRTVTRRSRSRLPHARPRSGKKHVGR